MGWLLECMACLVGGSKVEKEGREGEGEVVVAWVLLAMKFGCFGCCLLLGEDGRG